LARRLANRRDAEDLAQEVYLRLLRIQDVGAIRDPRALALRVAANTVYEWRMSARNRLPHSSEPFDRPEEGSDPYGKVLHAQKMQALSRALDALTPMQRTVVLLHRRDGMTYEEIGKVVGLSVQMVNKHLAKGLMVCKNFLAGSQEADLP